MPTVFQAEPLYDDKDMNVTEIRTPQPTYSSTTKQTRTNPRPSSMQRDNRMFISVYLAFFVNILVMIMSVIFTFCKQHITTLLAYVNSSGFILRYWFASKRPKHKDTNAMLHKSELLDWFKPNDNFIAL